jgi:methionyl-tRNA formyltransferase
VSGGAQLALRHLGARAGGRACRRPAGVKLCIRHGFPQVWEAVVRIVIVGQQAFGKAVLEGFMARGEEIAGVFAAPERPGSRPDPLVVAAEEKKLPVFRFPKYSDPEAQNALRELNADIGVMAYVLLFAPPEFCAIPKHGMIQFHPSLLPLHRGPASIPWAIIRGRSETGLTIFRPTPGLDEGPVILQKRVAIGADDTAASLYFDKIFPLGVEALLQAADLVVAGRATEWTQDESQATYEGWVREAESRINWANHVDFVYDLIRGCNPAPGAWTTYKSDSGEQKLYLFDSKKTMAPTFGAVRGKKIGEVVSAGPEGLRILAQGGFIECSRVRLGDGAKVKSSEVAIPVGTILGG